MSDFLKDRRAAFHLVLLLAGALATTSACAQTERGQATISGAQASQSIITLTNRERRNRNLPPLELDRACIQAITGHVNDMAAGRYLSHQGRDGTSAGERYKRFNPAGRGAGENVAYNTYGTGLSFMQQWLRSPGHRGNILSPIYKGIGVAVRASCAPRGAGRRCYYYAGQCFSP